MQHSRTPRRFSFGSVLLNVKTLTRITFKFEKQGQHEGRVVLRTQVSLSIKQFLWACSHSKVLYAQEACSRGWMTCLWFVKVVGVSLRKICCEVWEWLNPRSGERSQYRACEAHTTLSRVEQTVLLRSRLGERSCGSRRRPTTDEPLAKNRPKPEYGK